MKAKFNFLDLLAFSIFLFNFFIFLNVPFSFYLFDFILFIQISLFLVFFSYYFEFDFFFNLKLPRFKGFNILFYFLFLSFFVSSYVINVKANLSLGAFIKLFSYPIVVFIFFIYLPQRLIEESIFFDKCLKYIMYFAVFDALYSIASSILGFQQSASFPGHMLGLFYHPNTHSFIFSITIPIVFYFYFTKKVKTVILIIFLVLFLYVLLNTFSRAGFMATGLGILIITYFRSKKFFFIAVILMILISINVFLVAAEAKTDSSLSRGLLLLAAYQMLVANPSSLLFGYGVYESLEIFRTEKVFLGSLELVLDPHNWFLLLGIQFGILVPLFCLIIFLVIIIKIFGNLKKIKNSDNYYKIAVSVAIAISLFFQNFLEDLIVYPEFFVMPVFLFFAGYLYVNLKNLKLLGV